MRIRTWKYPAECFEREWHHWMKPADVRTPALVRWVTVDLDSTDIPPLTVPDTAFVRRSAGGRGLHAKIRVPLMCDVFQLFQWRHALGDDPIRIKMDAYRWSVTHDKRYVRGIVFDRKRGQHAGPWVRVGTWRLRARAQSRVPRLVVRHVGTEAAASRGRPAPESVGSFVR